MITIDGNISQRLFGAVATINIKPELQPIKFTQVRMEGRKKEKFVKTFSIKAGLPLAIENYNLGFLSTDSLLDYNNVQYLIH